MTSNVWILPTGTVVRESGRSQFFNKVQLISINNIRDDRSDMDLNASPCRDSRFPRFRECAHFHYETVNISSVELSLIGEKFDVDASKMIWFHMLVARGDRGWTVRSSFRSLCKMDRLLHQCVFNRTSSQLPELQESLPDELSLEKCFKLVGSYIECLSSLLFEKVDLVSCGPILVWLEIDNKGKHTTYSDLESLVNVPAVGAGQVIKSYIAQAFDELTIDVGDIISIVDKPPQHESTWWQGKKEFKVGYFPSECVELITGSSKLHSPNPDKAGAATKPVLKKREKFVALLMSFFSSRPNKILLKRAGIVRERLFGCDLSEHLSNCCREVPEIVTTCMRFIEEKGIVDGVYRLSGAVSNVQKLRNQFDADEMPNLECLEVMQDLHCIPSLLKMYFRELPNPLFTHQLYDKFLETELQSDESSKVDALANLISLLPPPHHRTTKALFQHLSFMASKHSETNMTSRNLSIVWAPNILQPVSQQVVNLLKTANMQAAVVFRIINNFHAVFRDAEFKQDCKPSRPASSGPGRLISLEEAKKIFGGGANLPVADKNVLSNNEQFPHIHSVIDLPRGFVGRKKFAAKTKWFKSQQDLPNLGKITLTNVKTDVSEKTNEWLTQTCDSYDGALEVAEVNAIPSKPLSCSDPSAVDSAGLEDLEMDSDDVILRKKSDSRVAMEADRKQALQPIRAMMTPPSETELRLAKENLFSVPSDDEYKDLYRMKVHSSNEKLNRVGSKKDAPGALKKMEKFLQGQIIEEEDAVRVEMKDVESLGDIAASTEDSFKALSLNVNQRRQLYQEQNVRDAEVGSVIMNELIKWKETKMKEMVRSEESNKISPELSPVMPSNSLDRSMRIASKLRGSIGRGQSVDVERYFPKQCPSASPREVEGPRNVPGIEQTNKNNSSFNFDFPHGCLSSSYVEIKFPDDGDDFVHRKFWASRNNMPAPFIGNKNKKLETYAGLPAYPPQIPLVDHTHKNHLPLNISSSCGDLCTSCSSGEDPPETLLVHPAHPINKCISIENIHKQQSLRSYPARNEHPTQRHIHESEGVLYRDQQRPAYQITDRRNLRSTGYVNDPIPNKEDPYARDARSAFYPRSFPRRLVGPPFSGRPSRKFVTVINLDSPERCTAAPPPTVPGSTVIML